MKKNVLGAATLSRVLLTALCVTLAIVLVLMIAVTVSAGFLSKSNQPEHAHTLQEVSAATEVSASQQWVATELKTAPEENTKSVQVVNLLLVGKDEDGKTGTRSDSMILCTFNKKEKTITMTSFLRDLYVKIPGYGKDRINAAYNFGGTELLKQTIQENFGVQIDGSIQVDFECFAHIIDYLGGVTLELTSAEAAYVNRLLKDSHLEAGWQLLNGKEALVYARNRHDTDGDFSRTGRQRKLLMEIIRSYKDQKLTRMLKMVKEIAPMVQTDISKSDLTGYAVALFPMFSSATIRTQALPVEGGYRDAKIGGKAVLVPDLEKNKHALQHAMK